MAEHPILHTIPAAIREANTSGPKNICNDSDYNDNFNDELYPPPSMARMPRAVQGTDHLLDTRKRKQTAQLEHQTDGAAGCGNGAKKPSNTAQCGKHKHTETGIHDDAEEPTPAPRTSRRPRGLRGCNQRLHQQSLGFQPLPFMVPDNAIPPTQLYGDGVEPKPDGIFRLAYGNINGFSTAPFNNHKANLLKHWLWHVDADFFTGNEAQINWSKMPFSGRLPEMFCTENALQSIAGYNTHKNLGRQQYGRTFQLTFGAMSIHFPSDACNCMTHFHPATKMHFGDFFISPSISFLTKCNTWHPLSAFDGFLPPIPCLQCHIH